jgi:hypothetical protein
MSRRRLTPPRPVAAVLAALVTAAVLAAGCTSSGSPKPTPTPIPPGTPLTPAGGSGAPPSVPAEASGGPTTPGTVNEDAHPITQPVALGAGQATVTVLAYQQPVGPGAKPPPFNGYVWGAANVKICVAAATSVTSKGW